MKIKQLEFGPYNCNPVSGPFFLDNSDPLYPAKVISYSSIFEDARRMLFMTASSTDVSFWGPSAKDLSTAAGGSMLVPALSDVYYGVPADSGTGTGYLAPDSVFDVLQVDVDPNTAGERIATLPSIEATAAVLAAFGA